MRNTVKVVLLVIALLLICMIACRKDADITAEKITIENYQKHKDSTLKYINK